MANYFTAPLNADIAPDKILRILYRQRIQDFPSSYHCIVNFAPGKISILFFIQMTLLGGSERTPLKVIFTVPSEHCISSKSFAHFGPCLSASCTFFNWMGSPPSWKSEGLRAPSFEGSSGFNEGRRLSAEVRKY